MGSKLDNWLIILSNEYNKPIEFKWGVDDCCLFSANIVKKLTNIDIAETFRNKYSTPKGAFLEIKNHGYKNVLDCADGQATKHGFKSIDINLAQKGDMVMAYFDDRQTIGIMLNNEGWFIGSKGYVYRKRKELHKAWAIR